MELVPDDVGNLNCQETWDRIPQLVYGSFTNVTQFVIPFTTIIICYAKIIIRNITDNRPTDNTKFTLVLISSSYLKLQFYLHWLLVVVSKL